MPTVTVLRLVLVVAAAGAVGCRDAEQAVSAAAPQRALTVETVEVVPRTLRETLTATGTLRAREAVTIRSEIAGVVDTIHFVEGASVTAGDLLLEIDDRELRAQRARVAARLELETATEARIRELLATRNASQATYDESVANLHVTQAELAFVDAQLSKTEIRAPFDGVVGLRDVAVGTYLTPGAAIVDLVAVDSLKLDFAVPERYQDALRVDMPVRLSMHGRPNRFEGRVYAIEPSVDVETRSVRLRAVVPNADGRLRPGAFAEVEVVLDEVPDAILVPAIALVPGLRRPTVLVVRDGVVESRAVDAGLRTADEVRIEAGLAPGDRVIVTGILQLRDGMAVTPVEWRPRG
ncbi:MAG TPA: efflux RND transporter periplasmic adaptor subunit [Actinomycetota bacterium]